MPQQLEIRIKPEDAHNESLCLGLLAETLGLKLSDIAKARLMRRSIDARRRSVSLLLRYEIYLKGEALPPQESDLVYQQVTGKPRVIIIGAGPAGLFAALRCLEIGLQPVVIERGKDVRARRRDLADIHKKQIVHPDSNYCFGEGGAGTYSDGKLYTRSKKRGDVARVLQILVAHGASEDILVDAHPHIGTNKLPKLIEAIRETILAHGGEIHFDTRVSSLLLNEGRIGGVITAKGTAFKAEQVILATGHSARDVFYMLDEQGIKVEFKTYALGVRVEHPQSFVDKVQYHCEVRGEHLPPSAYSLVQQIDGVGVYSFCMCPGGIIAPCATKQEEVVTNGWSPSKRNNPYANSGIVTTVDWEDIPEFHDAGAFAGLAFQASVEKKCWIAGGKTQRVPAQRLRDFVEGKTSADLPACSYQPGVVSARVDQILPAFIARRLQKAFVQFAKKMPGYLTNEAVVVAPESRTSSPIRIPRDKESGQHPDVAGLFPCGEGAGYAGGIVSAAMDGMQTADKCLLHLSAEAQ